jgi:hypothetical protein
LLWFEIMNFFQDVSQNLGKSVHFQKLYFSKFDCKKKWHIGEIINKIYKRYQNISFENSSLGNLFFGNKDPRKDNSPKCKLKTLVCYMLFGPNNDKGVRVNQQ